MAKSRKKLDVTKVIIAGVSLLFLVAVIAGIAVDWVSIPNIGHGLGELVGADTPERIGFTLAECATEWEAEAYNAMNALAIITVVVAALTVVGALSTVVVKNKIIKLCAAILGVATIVCAIIAVILTYNYCNDTLLSLAEATPAIGAWLLTIGGVLCGASGALAALK